MSGDNGTPPLDLSMFRDESVNFGADPELLGPELVRLVADEIAVTKRNLQREIGPSQIGVPCNRWLAHKFAGTAPTGIALPKWAAAVGTAVHAHFTDWLHGYNERHGVARFLADLKVYVGDLYPGRPIYGTLDGLDLATGTIIDLKCPSKNQMQVYGPGKPESEVYDIQVDLYGLGCANAGFPVASVGILRLPRAGQLHDAVWKARPHNPERARHALDRAGGIARMVDVLGTAAIPMQPTAEHYCGSCNFYLPNAADLTRACPGDAAWLAKNKARPSSLEALIA